MLGVERDVSVFQNASKKSQPVEGFKSKVEVEVICSYRNIHCCCCCSVSHCIVLPQICSINGSLSVPRKHSGYSSADGRSWPPQDGVDGNMQCDEGKDAARHRQAESGRSSASG